MRKSFKKCKQCTPVAKIHKISPLGESLFKIFYNIPLLHLNIDVTVATFISFFFHLFIHCSLFCLLAITTWLSLHWMVVTCHCWIRDFFFTFGWWQWGNGYCSQVGLLALLLLGLFLVVVIVARVDRQCFLWQQF